MIQHKDPAFAPGAALKDSVDRDAELATHRGAPCPIIENIRSGAIELKDLIRYIRLKAGRGTGHASGGIKASAGR